MKLFYISLIALLTINSSFAKIFWNDSMNLNADEALLGTGNVPIQIDLLDVYTNDDWSLAALTKAQNYTREILSNKLGCDVIKIVRVFNDGVLGNKGSVEGTAICGENYKIKGTVQTGTWKWSPYKVNIDVMLGDVVEYQFSQLIK